MRSGLVHKLGALFTVGLALTVPLWLAGFQSHPSSKQPEKKTRAMSNLAIVAVPVDPAVVSGQSLPVRTVLDNRGRETAEAPDQGGISQFAYILRPQKEGGPEYGLSQAQTMRRRSPDRMSLPPFQGEPIGAGEKLEWQEDIADYWNEGFEPGKYALTVRYDRAGIEGPRSTVTVLPLIPESLSSFVSEDHLSSVVAHRRQDGKITLMHRESDVIDPREGVFLLRHQLPSGPVRVATAIDVVRAGAGRWFAWTQDGKLSASVGYGNKIIVNAAPVPVDGTLLSPGFQVAVGTGLFGVVAPGGRLDTYLATSAGLKKHWSATLPGATGKVLWNAQPDGSVLLAWEESGSGRILRQSFGAEGHPKDASPQAVTPGRPVAWGLPPTGAQVIWVLAGGGPTQVFAKLPVNGERTTLGVPALEGATEYDFNETATGTSALVAVSGDRVMRITPGGKTWEGIHEGRPAQMPHVFSINGRTLWAEWVEPGYGIRRAKL